MPEPRRRRQAYPQLNELPARLRTALEHAGLRTTREVHKALAGPRPLTDLPGIGPATAEGIRRHFTTASRPGSGWGGARPGSGRRKVTGDRRIEAMIDDVELKALNALRIKMGEGGRRAPVAAVLRRLILEAR